MPHRKRIRLAPPKGSTGKARGTLFSSESLLFVSATQPPCWRDSKFIQEFSMANRRLNRVSCVWCVGILLSSYLLSCGPYHWLCTSPAVTPRVRDLVVPFGVIYFPLERAEAIRPVKSLLDWYLSFWEG